MGVAVLFDAMEIKKLSRLFSHRPKTLSRNEIMRQRERGKVEFAI